MRFRCWYPKLCFSFVNHIVFIYYRTIKDLYIALLLITLYFPLCWSVTLFFIYYRRLVSSFEKVNLHAVSPFQSCFCSKSIDVVLIELWIAAIRWLIANHVICIIQFAKIMYSSIQMYKFSYSHSFLAVTVYLFIRSITEVYVLLLLNSSHDVGMQTPLWFLNASTCHGPYDFC